MQTTRLGRRWLTTKFVFMVVLIGFGVWGFLDATIFYKNRGLNDASYKLRVYLEAARNAGRLSPGSVRVEDPVAARAEMRPRRSQIASATVGDGLTARQAAMDLARLDWLDSLASVWMLSADPQPLGTYTPSAPAGPAAGSAPPDKPRQLFFDPVRGEGFATAGSADDTRVTVELGGLLDELTRKWNTQPKSKALSSYDMAVQWIFVVVGIGGGLYLAFVIFRAAATKFRWDPAAKRLELPGGRAIVPADLKDLDKRKWHKFYVTLNLNDGSNIELDLYKFDPLEEWVLDMERTAFPDRARAEAGKAGAAKSADSGSGGENLQSSDDHSSSDGAGGGGGGDGGGGGGGGD